MFKSNKTIKLGDNNGTKTIKLDKLGTEKKNTKAEQQDMNTVLLKYEILKKNKFEVISPNLLWQVKNENGQSFAILKGDMELIKKFHSKNDKGIPVFLEVINPEKRLCLLSLNEPLSHNLDFYLGQNDELESLKLIRKLLPELAKFEKDKIVLANLNPKLIAINLKGNPVIFYPFELKKEGEMLSHSYFNSYTPPEVSLNKTLRMNTISYIVAAMMYKAIFGEELPEPDSRAFPTLVKKINHPYTLQLFYESLQDDPDNRLIGVMGINPILTDVINFLEQREVNFDFSSKVTIGLNQKRKKNQDSLGSFILEDYFDCLQKSNAFFCVADGMGGGISGELASKTTVQVVKSKLLKNIDKEEEINTLLKDGIVEADKEIKKLRSKMAGKKDMGTTMSALYMIGNKMYMGHVGDSRIYHLKSNSLEQLSKDHSFVQTLVDKHQITKEEARRHSNKNIITKSVGSGTLKKEDVYTFEDSINKDCMELFGEGYFLLCSDGIWEGLGDMKIEQLMLNSLKKKESLEEMNKKITETALELDGSDNTSCLIVHYVVSEKKKLNSKKA